MSDRIRIPGAAAVSFAVLVWTVLIDVVFH